jgi:aminopeptidase N
MPRLCGWAVCFLVVLGAAVAAAQRPRGPFTEPVRSVRSRAYDLQHTRLELALDWDKQELRGRATHTLRPFQEAKTIELDAGRMTIEAVARPDADPTQRVPLRFHTQGDKLTVELDRPWPAGEDLELAIDYRVVAPDRGLHFVLPDASEPNQPRMAWTQSEPEDARFWYPCFDAPGERITSETLVTVPEEYFVLSNGTLVSKGEAKDGKRTWHWKQDQNHAPYLVSVVAGPFEAHEAEWDGIPIVSYVPPGRLADAPRSFAKTPAMMQFFSEKIGFRYPWVKYAQICPDEYTWGGMEHTSCTTLNPDTLHDERAHLDVSSDNLVAHELAHQWWGDLLTCKDWGELWLNESFATYFATLWQEHDLGADEAAWHRRAEANAYFSEDEHQYRRPIVSYRYTNPTVVFDSHSYPKGARVLHMLRYLLGDEQFWKSLNHYCHEQAFDVVETADLRTAIAETTGQQLNWFFNQWVHHGGHPEYHVTSNWDEASKSLKLTVEQTQTLDELTPLFRMPIEIELVTDSGVVTKKVEISKAEETFVFPLESRPRRVLFDPHDWVLKKLDFEKSKEEWLDQAKHDPRLICRADAVVALGKLLGDEQAEAALIAAAKGDAFWGVREEAVKALGKRSSDAVRVALLGVARDDRKSTVRRAAASALGNFAHADVSAALRKMVVEDPSYYAAADALGSLVKVDRQGVKPDLMAALERPSHNEVILRAACEGLADIDDESSRPKLLAMLEQGVPHERRSAAMRAIARMGKGDKAVTEKLGQQLNDGRLSVRESAIRALAATNDPAAVDLLQARRPKELRARTVESIDEAIAKLRGGNDLNALRQRVGSLEEEKKALEGRVKKLEDGSKP